MASKYPEGKTLGVPCNWCEEGKSVLFCVNCSQSICDKCVTIHGRIPGNKHHKLISVDEQLSTMAKQTKQARCSNHSMKVLRNICSECLEALCEDCEKKHTGHKLLQAGLDAVSLQKISIQKTPGLMDLMHGIDKLKDGTPRKVELYNVARDIIISGRDKLMHIISDDSQLLIDELDSGIKKQKIITQDISEKVDEFQLNADCNMTALSNARNISDPTELLYNIHQCDLAMEKGKQLIQKLQSSQELFRIDDLLPFRNKLQNLEKDLHEYFTFAQITQSAVNDIQSKESCAVSQKAVTTIPKYRALKRLCDKHLGKAKGKVGIFCISESNFHNTDIVVMYDMGGTDVHVYDVTTNTTQTYTCEKTIVRMTTLSHDRHVIRDMSFDVHVVDGSFRVISTMNRASDWDKYKPQSLCRKQTNMFILGEKRGDTSTRLSEVSITRDGKFRTRIMCEVDVYNSNGLITLHRDMEHVTLSVGDRISCTSLFRVNLRTGQYTAIDISRHTQGGTLYCISKDQDDQTLVGDTLGNVHMLSGTTYERSLSQMKVKSRVSGIAVRNDKFITVCDGNIIIYQ